MSFELSLVQGAYPIKQYSVCCLKTSNLAEFLVLGNTHLETPDSVRKVCRFSSSHIKLTRTPQQLYTRSWFPESNSVIMISTTTKKHKLIVANHAWQGIFSPAVWIQQMHPSIAPHMYLYYMYL